MAEVLHKAMQPVFQPVEKLRGALQREPGSSGVNPVLSEKCQANLSNLSGTVAAGLVAAQHRVTACAGSGNGLHLGLWCQCPSGGAAGVQPAAVLPTDHQCGGVWWNRRGRHKADEHRPSDLLIAIAFPRYASDAITLSRYARDRGARIVAITDSVASPLVPWSHDVLLAAASHPVLSSSYTGAVLVVEALITSLMLGGSNHVAQATRLADAVSSYLYRDRPGNERKAARKKKEVLTSPPVKPDGRFPGGCWFRCC